MKHDPSFSYYTQVNCKWVKDLNAKAEILNLLEGRVGSKFQDIGSNKDFLNRTLMAQETRPAINKWDFMKLVLQKKLLVS